MNEAKELVAVEQRAVCEEITEQRIIEYLDSAGITSKLLENEKKMFINIAREFQLNPFKRELHITAYGQGDNRKCSIITGYEVYIKRAERTGKLDGWEANTEGEGKNMKAVVKIYRKDQKYPFVHEAYYIECCQYNKDGYPNAVWAKQPRFMTKKVAIGQAFRLCFPDEFGGMPYEESEMPPEERNVTPHENENGNGHGNGNSLAGEALNGNGKTKQETQPDQNSIIEGIGKMITALNPDKLPYFTDEEKALAKTKVENAKSAEELKNLHDGIKADLEQRKVNYKQGTSVPAAYTVPEPEFVDDIPF
jgi:phage recombination protein Bet